MNPARSILVVDDEKKFAEVLAREIEHMGFIVRVEHDGEAALAALDKRPHDVMLLDVRMPGMSGIEVLRRVRELPTPPEVIMLTGHATIDTALEAMKLGAYDYLTKPCKLEELEVLLLKAAEKSDVLRSNRTLRKFLGTSPPGTELIGSSESIREIVQRLEKIAQATDAPVLITGESGTGKELIAREIHRHSRIADQPFVTINCAVLQSTLLESELFGHEKGAFTGADEQKIGLFEVAQGGTLFLDEIAEAGASVQAKLLRAVQFGEFRRVGGTEPIRVSVRIIAATNRDLEARIAEGKFREDLYYRLNVLQIHAPPLREHVSDIRDLVHHFVDKFTGSESPQHEFDTDALELLCHHEWPGNVRELQNFVRRLLVFQDTPRITATDVRVCFNSNGAPEPSTSLRVEDVEREHILRVLGLCGGNKTRTAEKLGIALKTLYNKLNSYRKKGLAN